MPRLADLEGEALIEWKNSLNEDQQREHAWKIHAATEPVTDRDTLGMDGETYFHWRRNHCNRREYPDNSLDAYIERTDEWWEHV